MELLDQHGVDVLQTLGRNRDLATAEETDIFVGATQVHPTVDETDTLTLRISNNLVASAQMTIELLWALGK